MRAVTVLLAAVAVGAWAPARAESGGAYELVIGKGKPIAIRELVFGDPNVIPARATSNSAPVVTVSIAADPELASTLVEACVRGSRWGNVAAVFKNDFGLVEYTVDLSRVAVTSVTIPGVAGTSRQLGTLSFALSPASAKLHFGPTASGAGLSRANRDRLQKSHNRLEAAMWGAIQHQSWRAKKSGAPSDKTVDVRIELDGSALTGITEVGLLIVEHEPGAKPVLAPVSLVMDADHARVYRSAVRFRSGEIGYTWSGSNGRDVRWTLKLNSVTVEAETPSADDVAKKVFTVLLQFDSVTVAQAG